ncbi:N-6 DNA methylase [Thiomicrorhabdus sp. 6S2-11]|uniref:site-specific DNA-methyltransferase (adenine-specific) n=1 Tax=Thiomicrorhabdus marina TaxID=2818442 RepID=A0ABS3Q2J6_9GAMM|nr:type ISP restriction/modification enzyme [Thiomicrorhabdus marina]MBO1926539.1 N-6 DNA methylase [Thiomicrorhabdus marina]
MQIADYLDQINQRLAQGHTSEHTFRTDLEQLFRTLLPDHHIINEPSKITDCGNPDFVITKKGVPIGYIEAKDIGKDLKSKNYIEQFNRYKKALDNLIITDYVWFQFFEKGELIAEIRLGQPAFDNPNQIEPEPKHFAKFEDQVRSFGARVTQAIKSPVALAEFMAGKARLLQTILQEALEADLNTGVESELTQQFKVFHDQLIHDLEPNQFADLYAQTLAYGMFAARYHDPTLPTFDRDEAARLIPQSNPLLRNLFQSIAGYNIDARIRPTVDNLAEIFLHADVKSILQNYGKKTAQTDPIIHFYETFLAKYDAKLRKARGVWYTPQPVVNFIVRAVDEILKSKFGIVDGLADNSKTSIEVEASADMQAQGSKITKRKGKYYGTKEVHRVQILDPATGTGTFLAEVVNFLYQSKFQHMQGIWPQYVEEHLVPRLNGFELLMASYAMAHLKLDMLLGETGCSQRDQNNRLRIFLTNSLEEYHPDTHSLFSQWLSNEAREANAVKKDTPVMVVLGNPPYSGESANKGDWIMSLMDDYKKEPGGKQKLQERNPKWINDDYVKFMRFAQHFIEKNGEGVLAFINPHGFLDNPTFRGMRWNLLKTYDEIYTIDLHGNGKKKEVCPDGSKDENVFDIEQGVSINLLVKTGKKGNNELGKAYHYDLWGKRKDKYAFLESTAFKDVPYQPLPNIEPMYFMVPKDFGLQKVYDQGFAIPDLFKINNVGIVTSRDGLVIDDNVQTLQKKIQYFLDNEPEQVKKQLGVRENKTWKIADVQHSSVFDSKHIETISYRPFDIRYIYFDPTFIERSRLDVMQHMLEANLGLATARSNKSSTCDHFYISKYVMETKCAERTIQSALFPLYLYPEDGSERTPNLNPEEIKAFEKALKLAFKAENNQQDFAPSNVDSGFFTPIDILDYIYAVLHSPTYRETYKEFLKTDFPRVPYPTSETFWQLVTLGDELRRRHLLEHEVLNTPITSYPQAGDNVVTRKMTKTSIGYEAISATHGKVWINDDQYFDQVPLKAWEFYIGGYQPAQKWLKDRQGRTLNFEDILHYQKIIVALTETERLMQAVDIVLYPEQGKAEQKESGNDE